MMQTVTQPTMEYREAGDPSAPVNVVGTAANDHILLSGYGTGSRHDQLDPQSIGQNIMVDPFFGGYDDPFVVSDEDFARTEAEELHRRRRAILSHFTQTRPSSFSTEEVTLSPDRRSSIENDYGWKLSALAGFAASVAVM